MSEIQSVGALAVLLTTLFATPAGAASADRHAMALPPAQDTDSRITQGKLEADLGRLADGALSFRAVAEDAMATDTARWEALVRLGAVLRASGDHAGSLEAFEQVVFEHGDVPEARRLLLETLTGAVLDDEHWEAVVEGVGFERDHRSPDVPPLRPVWTEDPPGPRGPQALDVVRIGTGAAPFDAAGERLSLDLKDAALQDVLRLYSTVLELNILVMPGTRGHVTLEVSDRPHDEILDHLLRAEGLAAEIQGELMYVGSPESLDRLWRIDTGLGAPFTGEPLSMSFRDARLGDVLSILEEATGLRIEPDGDWADRPTVTLSLSDVPGDQVLDAVLRLQGVAGELVGDTLRLSPAARRRVP